MSTAGCLKRLRRELKEWDQRSFLKEGHPSVSAWKRWAAEADLWTLYSLEGGGPLDCELREPETDLPLLAVLRVSRGPFAGGEVGIQVGFPPTYPFQPPLLGGVVFCGLRVPWEDAVEGLEVEITPQFRRSPADRLRCRVRGRTPAGELVLSGSTPNPDGRCPREDVSEPGDAQGHLLALCDGGAWAGGGREWWECGAHPVDARTLMYSPLVDPTGRICLCGFERGWSPTFVFAAALAFARVAVEECGPSDEELPVPAGHEKTLCFCKGNPEADRLYRQDYQQWHRTARARFFPSWLEAAPLSLVARLCAPDELEVDCLNLAGRSLARLRLHPHGDGPADLLQRLRDAVPASEAKVLEWRVVLPDGSCLDESRQEASVAALFSL